MKLLDIEQQFKELTLKKEAGGVIDKHESEAQKRIWEQVSAQMPKRSHNIMPWALAAASVALVATMWFYNRGLKERDETIAQLQNQLKAVENSKNETDTNMAKLMVRYQELQNRPPIVDTVYKTKIVYRNVPIAVPEPIAVTDCRENMNFGSTEMAISNGFIELAKAPTDIESIKIVYGERTKQGVTPWTFTVKYQ